MRYESEMIAPIKSCLAGLWDNTIVIEEVGVGYGVADVVAARPNRQGVHQRHRLGQRTVLRRRADVQVMRSLRDIEAASFNDLLRLTGISLKRLRYEIVPFLIAENYIKEVEEGRFQILGKYQPVACEIWAVEAKLKNWFEGLCQARRYQHFAHKVYLAISLSHLKPVREEIMRNLNVGLIAVTQHEAKIVFHPSRQTPHSEDLFLLTNERIWEQIHTTE